MVSIALFPSDEGPCGNYRMLWPAAALAAEGVQIYRPGESISSTDDIDVIVFQRPTGRKFAEGLHLFQERGAKVVVELDDDYSTIPVENQAREQYDPRNDPEDNWAWLAMACRRADRVVCTTEALKRKYGFGHGVVVPNYVPARNLECQTAENDPLMVGWSGNLQVHKGDLDVVRGGVASALNATGADFRLVGATIHAEEVGLDLGLGGPAMATGWVELDSYADVLGDLDVGLVPLASNVFNESKSYLKGLEYASVGVPFVATPTQPYRQLADMGAGLLAARPQQWRSGLLKLLKNDSFRQEMRESGLAVAQANTIEGNAWRFHEAWSCGA